MISSPSWPGSWPSGPPPPSTAPGISPSIDVQILDDLPLPSQLGATRTGGIDLNKPRIRATLSAALALTAAPCGFTVAEFTAKFRAITGRTGYTTRQAPYDLESSAGRTSSTNPAGHAATTSRTAPPAPSPPCLHSATRSSPPILASIRSPRKGHKPATWTRVDRDYETLRIGMQTLFHDLGITPSSAAA